MCLNNCKLNDVIYLRVKMETSDCKKKFKALFDKLFQDKFELSPEQTETLLTYLGDNGDKCVVKLLETPFFANLLVHALKNYEGPSNSVKLFITKLVSIVMSNEVLFTRLVHKQHFEQFTIQKTWLRGACNTLHQAMLQQAFATISHYTGVKHAVEREIYKRTLNYNTIHQPPGVPETIYEFIANFTWKLNEYEEDAALQEVLQYVVDPLTTYVSAASNLKVDTEGVLESILPFVNSLVYILGEVEHLVVPNNVVPMLKQTFSIESKLAAALEATRDTALARVLAEANLRYHYAASRQLVLLSPYSKNRANQDFYTVFNKIFSTLIQKRSYLTVIEFLSQCHVFWHRVVTVQGPVEFEKFGNKYLLQNQFIVIMLMPVFQRQKVKKLVFNQTLASATEIFHTDLAKTVPRDMIGTAHDFRKLVIETMGYNISPACTCALQELLRLKRQMSRSQACVVFKILYYALCEFVMSDGSDLVLLGNPLHTADDERYLALILEAIDMLLDEHEINWYESLEIIELQAVLMNLIKQNILPVKLLVRAVELVTTSVRKFLSPELALLMESARGGSLREAAGAARALMSRAESAARVAALQLVLSFIEVAYVKFMPLRTVISSHGLVRAAASCALRDADARAQAAALRCLAAAARCEGLWTELLDHCHNLYEQLVNIMQHNSEGEVRKQAANVLTHVYVNRKVTDVFTRYVSKAMARSATEDPHWPVQMSALNFWKQLMHQQLSDRGMIDGTFPSVTFCKDKRKIIVLNDKEIHKQLEIIMGQLSTTGCLAVLLKCLDSNNHKDVIDTAYEITNVLVEILDRYKYTRYPIAEPRSPASVAPVDVNTSWNPGTVQLDHDDVFMDIFGCLDSKTSCPSPIEVIHPHTFIEVFREVVRKRPTKVDLGTLIDEIIAL